MDADRERVTRRAAEGTSKKELREKTENLSEAHLREWLEEQGDVDPADYADTKHPANAIPIADWVNLQTSLMPAAAAKGDVLPRSVDALAKYAQVNSYKLNAVLALLTRQGRMVQSTTPGWEDMLAKFPWMAGCDDHVKNVPRSSPLLLSRTRAVSTTPPYYLLSFTAHNHSPLIAYNFLYEYAMILSNLFVKSTITLFMLSKYYACVFFPIVAQQYPTYITIIRVTH
jgi:hypothetical protein